MPKSTYYDRIKNERNSRTNDADDTEVFKMFAEHNGSFGRRMLKRLLEGKGIIISEKRISRIMKGMGLVSKYGRKKGKNVYSDPKTSKKYIQGNLFAELTEEELKKEIWSMDFTEEKIEGKKIYTCGIISVNRKIVVGYSQATKSTAELARETVEKAIREYGAPYMIMTDRGSQFTSKEFYDMMETYQIRHSMSRPYTPVDNRFIETFWKTMKIEIGKTDLLNKETYAMVVDYYIHYYNYHRPHSALGYKAPCAA